ncbi:23S rRNA (cytidine(2498)-2'-O)-methyltransferase RlmM [Kosakonia radicincitans DSM 16656]|uniref:Ribosomal RNA large subunit methyltransferase M n=1 Tax=Kosakonia radicincitans TaxID=283686 RepID=A0AAX2EPR3_9ENTR|nr:MULTISPECIES: 23S rRNA (cytidine(2498)-2'-O)-methyltransferase RlmM [Kosakonia]MDP9565848.1 23S rRNA (cytidine2498-2'-O)-methyltransferase [Kosakonia oryzae]APG19608.1 23S rRNA (cytidine(2498)-2'-O)-methyltransferase RlmM [Kosakonia radicincitans]ARD59268.1 23S rRNA (cytidine(2498)-2'-O)-methyltransferase RlmM [Kosakonia radicincitans DSM 16656]KDE35637.1 23S rRNA methyltransferase [Kosakonia radicincitans UMEnt01/12]MDD7998408.1 23S rRNA (cytidine(2498)-2'-O)-methyltransferase RlmM [Kosako
MNKVVLLCRPGFEKECAAEITDKAGRLEVFGFARVKENSGYVVFECYQENDADKVARELPFSSLIFARQMFVVGELLRDLPPEDRITPIVGMLQGVVEKAGDLRVEVADTNESKELMKFCRKFTVPLRGALREAGVLARNDSPKRPVVHIFFIAPGCCYTGYSYSYNNSPFYMGIPRLKFPSDAPSRSTLKLEEAFHVFIPADEWDERLANGMYAVDLGACPGGWTYQLVKRNMWVSSVDNGPMAQSLMDTGQVTWLREDGFRYRPNRNNISWMVCDMVEKPAKVAALMAQWLVQGWCRETIFNLKLPMKKRYEEVSNNLAFIQQQLDEHNIAAQIQARQLYHDREEVTVHVRRMWAAVGGRRDER